MLFEGVGVQFGISSSVGGCSGSFQTREHTYSTDVFTLKDGQGYEVNRTDTNEKQTAVFSWYITGSSGGSVATTLPAPGTKAAVADSVYTQIANTLWTVDKVKTSTTNTGYLKGEADLILYAKM